MKRTALMFLTLSGALLLSGCGHHWNDGGRHDRERGHDHGRSYDRGHDDRGRERGYERRHGDQRFDRNPNRGRDYHRD